MIVVDPWHWLHPDGSLPDEPTRLRARALTMAQCIEYGGPLPVHAGRETLIRCRRRPQGRPCSGLLWVAKTPAGEIHAFCPSCGSDEYLIHNWEQTRWANGPTAALPLSELGAVQESEEPGSPGSGGIDTVLAAADTPTLHQRIATALHMLKAPVQVATVFEIIDRAEQPSEVISAVMQHADVSNVLLVREFLQILTDAWQVKQQGRRLAMPWAHQESSLAGIALEQGGSLAAPPVQTVFERHPSREGRCPCGSGRPRHRCCLLN
ncbi:MAG: hypothetical protein B7733_08280 [Myxococcales bacterium FL481]|nr:MAG: hypothetical protein B7733_08280 [Myxococcales bacterium FL481]